MPLVWRSVLCATGYASVFSRPRGRCQGGWGSEALPQPHKSASWMFTLPPDDVVENPLGIHRSRV